MHGLLVPLAVSTVGHLVPRCRGTGQVHSVFRQACNLEFRHTLMTLCTAPAGHGPTLLHLSTGAAPDLLREFEVGEPFTLDDGGLRTRRTALDWRRATVWRPAEPHPSLPAEPIAAHLQRAQGHLAQHRFARPSVLDADAAGVVGDLQRSCARLDLVRAVHQAQRLIGWGEGLTPAGDDFLVGLLAGLDAWPSLGTEQRLAFRAGLTAALAARLQDTTPIAAHYLRLAIDGHFTETVLHLRDAVCAGPDGAAVDAALGRVLSIGASSGADMVSGLLAGMRAWQPAGQVVMAA